MKKHNYALSKLRAHKHLFTRTQYLALTTLAKYERYAYRKEIEQSEPKIAYLPSFIQVDKAITKRLAVIGLYLDAIPANDGTSRKLYALRALPNEFSRTVEGDK